MKTISAFLILSVALAPAGLAQAQVPYLGPQAAITSPANHAAFFTPVDIPLFATVVDAPHTTNVEFYAGTNYLGPAVNLGQATRPPIFQFAPPEPLLDSIWCLVWSNVPAGSYSLTVRNRGTDLLLGQNRYLSRTSAPVNITVVGSTATNNGPDVVSVVATDPVAVSGTNSWTWWGMTNTTPSWTNWPPPHWQLFTNWGPKNGLFTVRRFGDASDAVTVAYTLTGTATNGTNYAALPGSVTIPAGVAYALIPVVPIDTGPPYLPKTVILTLTPPTATAPRYSVGFPPRAVVVIEHDWVRTFSPAILADGSFTLNAAGPDGAWFDVETSADLLNWTSAGTNQVFQGSIDFVDINASSNAAHFYRVTPQNGPPTE